MTYRKKLIEVALPLEAINKASVRENYIYRGNPSSIHKWWAQRPLAAARAVIFAQMVDDPSAWPDLFPTVKAQEKERKRLFRIIEDLVLWENTTNEAVLERAREEIRQSWRRTCAENADHPQAKVLFDRNRLPAFHDPFAGGGTLPLEAQRLGLHAYAGDLNPVAALITKALIEIPPKFAGKPPVNPESRNGIGHSASWSGAQGLAVDVLHYGQWLRDEAEKRIGHLYPRAKVTAQMAKGRPGLRQYVGKELTVIAWLWARTVRSPNPAFRKVDVPLVTTFLLSTKPGSEVHVRPVTDGGGYHFVVEDGRPKGDDSARSGTKIGRGASFRCLMSGPPGTPITGDYIKAEAKAGRMGARLIAVVAEGERGRVYLDATREDELPGCTADPKWVPGGEFVQDARAFTPCLYGLSRWSDLFTRRQLVALTTLVDLMPEVRARIRQDIRGAGLSKTNGGKSDDGVASLAYEDAVLTYLVFAVDKYSMYGNSLVTWYSKEDRTSMLFSQNALPMVWDFVEVNPFSSVGGSLSKSLAIVADALHGLPRGAIAGEVVQESATAAGRGILTVISTDPPYYNNVPYADLSDFFYVWLRRSLKGAFPNLFTTLEVPKTEELVASPYRHGGKEKAEAFFLEGMTKAMHRLSEQAHPAFPVTIYYAFKQSESERGTDVSNTGWETFLGAVLQAGFTISGTWPMRTERTGRVRDNASNALASSVVLVCRPRTPKAPIATCKEFVSQLRKELPDALTTLQQGNTAPVDLAQAAIGPGMAVFSRYSKVVEADGGPMSVRTALQVINEELDTYLAEQEGEMDRETRFCIAWFDQNAMDEGEFGQADVLARAVNTAVNGLADAGVLRAKAGKVKLLSREELPRDWDPASDKRLTVWECTQQLIRALEEGGEKMSAALAAKLGAGKSEEARALAYRLYAICERKKWAKEALAYNSLVVAWPEIVKLAASKAGVQTDAFGRE